MKKIILTAILIAAMCAPIYAQGQLSPMPHLQFLTNTGAVCASCNLYSFGAGGSTPLATYSDSILSTANPTAIVLNSAGRPSVSSVEVALYLDPAVSYKIVLTTSLGATIWTQDNIKGIDSLLESNLALTTTGNGAALVAYSQATGVNRTVKAVLDELPTLKGAGAIGNGSTNDAGALVSACAANDSVIVGAGTYYINTNTSVACTLDFRGGILNVPTGKTLTLAKPPLAPQSQIFSGQGTITVNQPQSLWFGSTTQQIAAPDDPDTATGAAGGLTGTYYYAVSYVTPIGETEVGTVSASVAPSAQKVELTNIPVSADSTVTARKLYRTLATPADNTVKYLLATISDNTTTTYSDNIVDGSLGPAAPVTNTTGGAYFIDSTKYLAFSPTGFLLGYDISANSSASALLYGKFNATAALQKLTITGSVNILTVPEYADNTAALAGGLKVGDIYRTTDAVKVVH